MVSSYATRSPLTRSYSHLHQPIFQCKRVSQSSQPTNYLIPPGSIYLSPTEGYALSRRGYLLAGPIVHVQLDFVAKLICLWPWPLSRALRRIAYRIRIASLNMIPAGSRIDPLRKKTCILDVCYSKVRILWHNFRSLCIFQSGFDTHIYIEIPLNTILRGMMMGLRPHHLGL